MLRALAVANYRSLRDLVVPLAPMTVVTGANGVGKSNLYRALRLLQETALGRSIQWLAREGGLTSAIWAGPEQISRAMKSGKHRIEGTVRQTPINVKIGFADDDIIASRRRVELPAWSWPTR